MEQQYINKCKLTKREKTLLQRNSLHIRRTGLFINIQSRTNTTLQTTGGDTFEEVSSVFSGNYRRQSFQTFLPRIVE